MVKLHRDTFMESQPNQNHTTRFKNQMNPVSHRLNFFQSSPQFTGPKVQNHLSSGIRKIIPFSTFKILKIWLLDKAFYSVQEFF